MAQLPASMRPKRAAITSIHEKPPTRKDKLVNIGGWVLMVIAIVVLLAGIFGLYKVITDARVATLNVVGISSDIEKQQITQHLQPVVQNNYFTSDLEQIRDRTLEIPWVDRVVVSRTWPNSISVRIVPRHAIARWGTGCLLSDAGVVFTEATVKDNSKLPMLHGPLGQAKAMMRRYNEINQLFQPAQLRLKD